MNGLDLFSGIGGLSLALAPWVRPVAYCENARFAQSVLLARMADGRLPLAPIWDDITTLSGKQFFGLDIIFGGFPCQPHSSAARGRNKPDFLRQHFIRLVAEIRPSFVFAENVSRKSIEGFSKGIEPLGYKYEILGNEASEVGASFVGRRYWTLASSDSHGKPNLAFNDEMADVPSDAEGLWSHYSAAHFRVADGLPSRVDRLAALGNAVHPAQARLAFKRLGGVI